MAILPGKRVGPYEILSAIGAGGMGEVYRARDARLNRDVALKVLPEIFAADPDRMARFEREARVLGALNHPNIAAIYGVEEFGSGRALVMELVQGPTLADRISSGPIPIDEALPIAKQVAEALEYAHDHGVIHRDLKPANIKVTADGAVKVLDFGLAKALLDEPVAADPRDSPTLSMAATMPGVILGTAAYMSPEQAKSKPVDRRADIWAFGVVLFEMLTGKQLYSGETVAETLAFVMTKEPALGRLPSSTPTTIRNLLRRCLEKNPRQRLQHIGEARIVIEGGLSGAAPADAEVRRKLPLGWLAAAFLFVTTIALGIAYFYRTPSEVAPMRFFVYPPEKESFDSGAAGAGFAAGVISPDGRRLALTAKDASGKILIWVRPLDTLTPQALQGTDDAAFPFWSPDSRSIGFFAQGKLKRIDVAGGPAQTLCDTPIGRGGTWNRDGVILFAPYTFGSLYRVTSAGGTPVAVTKPTPQQSGHRWPSFLPDGRHFIYFAASSSSENSGVFVGTLDSGESKRVLAADTSAIYSAPSGLLFVRQGTLLRQSFDPKKLELSGDPTPVAEGVAVGLQNVSAFSVSENGVLAYRNGPSGSGDLQLAWVDRTGKSVETVGTPGAYRGVDVSPDGTRIAVHRHDGSGGDIWLFDSGRRGTMSRFTFDASQDNSVPIWSPDGSRIAFGSLRNGKWGIYQKPANGTGREESLLESDLPKVPMSWSPDGNLIVYQVYGPNITDQWVLPLAGDRKPVPLLQSPFRKTHPQVSPDGKWIAYTSDETGRSEIYVRPFPSGEGKWQISSNGGFFPRWRRDGKELFYMGAVSQGKMISVKVNPAGPTFEYGDPVALFDSGYVEFGHVGLNYHTYAVSLDGQRFLIPRPESTSSQATASAPMTVVVNWTAELKKK